MEKGIISMQEKIKVTFLFDDDEHFHRFLEANKIDVYTYNWKKHEYLVDLASDVKTSMTVTEHTPVEKPAGSSVNDFI